MRVLVADDDDGVTSVVARTLTREGYDVRTASDGDQAVHAMREWAPDAIVLDVLMPGRDGLAVCRQVRSERPDIGILMLTAKDGAGDQIVGLDAGADDYLVKPFSLQVLAAHLRAVLRRREPSPEILRVGDLELDVSSRTATRGTRFIALTTTEFKMLLHLARDAGQVIAKAELTRRVWGYDFEGNENVCEVYVGYLRQKLEAGGEPRLIHTLRGAGYTLRTTP
ncbi:MAG TPA: response regulator transcription factor [Candidatus Limnocylindria bacterium]|nr:response regulator transcription factor [Candidatus Limnocylindria bacterium]